MNSLRGIEAELRSNKFLAAAVEDLDGFDHARTVAAQARVLLRQVEDPKPVSSPLDSGEAVTLEWAAADVAHRAEAEQAQTVRTRLEHLAVEAESRAAGMLSGSSNDLLVRFNSELRSLMDEAAELASHLDGARTAAESIPRGTAAVDAWRDLDGLAGAMAQLRAAQMKVAITFHSDRIPQSRTNFSNDPLASDLMLRNLDEVWPTWRQPPRNRIDLSRPRPRIEPWPTDATEQLVWLVTGPAEPWVPTTVQLDKLHRSRAETAAIENARKHAEQRHQVFDGGRFRASKPHLIGGNSMMS